MSLTAGSPPADVRTRDRRWRRAAEGRQDGAFISKKALAHVVQLGQTKEAHFIEASEWARTGQLPFHEALLPDLDLRFAVSETVKHRHILRRFRRKAKKALLALCARMQPVSDHLKAFQPESVRSVAGAINVAAWAALVVILGWPDTGFPYSFIRGFQLLGALQRTGIFPPDPRFDEAVDPRRLLKGAAAFNKSLHGRTKYSKQAAFMVEAAEAEYVKDLR